MAERETILPKKEMVVYGGPDEVRASKNLLGKSLGEAERELTLGHCWKIQCSKNSDPLA